MTDTRLRLPAADTTPAPDDAAPTALALLRATRRSTAVAVAFLGVQLYGNLYEQIVTNPAVIADPRPGELVGELDAGSPLYYYLPWAPLGVALAVALAVRVQRRGPGWVARRLWGAVAALTIAVAAKIVLITQLNDSFRDPLASPADLRREAILWAFGNGLAILAVAAAIVLLTTWRTRLLDQATRGTNAH